MSVYCEGYYVSMEPMRREANWCIARDSYGRHWRCDFMFGGWVASYQLSMIGGADRAILAAAGGAAP